MPRAPDRSVSRRDTLTFVVCVLLSFAALAMPGRWTQAFAIAVRETALLPLVWLQQRAEEGRTSRSRLQAVMAARDSASLAAMRLPALEAENEQLRRLLGIAPSLRGRFVGAEVLHQAGPTDGRTLLLGVGTLDGVATYDIVLAPEGLVGVVARAGAHSSIANTWAHPEFRVSGVTASGEVLGIVAPSPNTLASDAVLEFRGVAYRDTVAVGTLVMTAGLGDVYPRGIPVGRVVGVRQEHLGWERVYQLLPLANPGYVSHVLVLHPGVQDSTRPRPATRDSTR